MRINDQSAYARCHARASSEFSGSTRGPFEAAHAIAKGIGGSTGPTVDANLVLLTRSEHRAHHDGRRPTQAELLDIIGARYGVSGEAVKLELWRIINLSKGSCPNVDRPTWCPEYVVAPDRKRRVRGAKVGRWKKRVELAKARCGWVADGKPRRVANGKRPAV